MAVPERREPQGHLTGFQGVSGIPGDSRGSQGLFKGHQGASVGFQEVSWKVEVVLSKYIHTLNLKKWGLMGDSGVFQEHFRGSQSRLKGLSRDSMAFKGSFRGFQDFSRGLTGLQSISGGLRSVAGGLGEIRNVD